MDKGKKNIDQLFKEGLNKSSFEIPEAFANDLNQRLNGLEKKKRGFFLWFFLLFCLIDFSVIALLLINNTQSPIYTMSNRIADPIQSFPISIDSTHNHSLKEIQIDGLQNSRELSQINSSDIDYEEDLGEITKHNPEVPGSENTISKGEIVSSVSKNRKSSIYTDQSVKTQPKKDENIDQEAPAIDESLSNSRNTNSSVVTRSKERNDNSVNQVNALNIEQSETAEPKKGRNRDNLAFTKDESLSNSGNTNSSTTTTNEERNNNSLNQENIINTEQSETVQPKEGENNKHPNIVLKSNEKEHSQSSLDGTESINDAVATSSEDKTKEEALAATNNRKLDSESTPSKVHSTESSDTTSKTKENNTVVDLLSNEESKEVSAEEENNGLHQGSKNISNWKAEIQLYAGFGSTIINDNAADDSYLGMVNGDRKPLNTPTFGVNGNISYKSITFGLGVSYLQTGETYSAKMNKINFSDISYLDLDSIVETISYYQPYGTFIGDSTRLTIDSVTQIKTVSDTTTSLREVKNRYSWLSVPVYFGYHFSFGKYELTPRIGAQFNFGVTENSGQYPTSNFEDISTFNAARFNVSYLVNIEIKRNFNNWSIFARPYFKSMIGPAINESILQRKYSSWGIQVGVGFDL